MDSTVTVSTPYDNAVAFLDLCNAALKENAVLDSKGNQAFFVPVVSSPAWLFALAHGTLETIWQGKLRDGVNGFSLENCSDAQVLNLAEIAGMERDTGRPTTANVVISSKDTASCTVTEGDLYTCAGYDWYAASSVTLSPSQQATITFVSEVNAAIALVMDQNFVPAEPNAGLFSSIYKGESTPGEGLETITSLRQRLMNQEASINALDACTKKIETLVGIVSCSIYFNDSLTTTLTLPGGTTLAPRTALITVFGTDVNDLIGATFYSLLAVPTKVGTHTSVYRTYSGQVITVNYNKAAVATIQVKVFVEAGSGQGGYTSFLKNAIVSASGSLKIGENYSAQYLSANYLHDFPYATVLGVQVYDGTSWGVETALTWNSIGVFTTDSITVEEV